MAFSVGQIVGDYQIIDILGAGGMGTVYKVQHLISNRIEAMKVVLPDLADSAELADRFIREIRLQASLSHPNIASLHNALRHDNQLLMIMEYIDGITLSSRLKHGRVELALSVEVIVQVLRALSYAHAQGIVHRDVKPANIMVAQGGVVKLMDFGIARSSTDRVLTQTGAALGSLYYMSPEQVQGTAVDGRSDLYSTGVMFYEMVTGTKPFSGESSWAVMNAHLSQVPRAPTALNSELPNALSLAILRAIEKEPANRYQTAAEFSGFLEALRNRYLAPGATGAPHLDSLTMIAKPVVSVSEQVPAMPREAPRASASEPRVSSQPKLSTEPQAPTVPRATPTPPSAVENRKRFEAEELDRLKRELAAHVGPMSRLLVDRAAKKAKNWKELLELLSLEVPSGQERKKFLALRPSER